METGVAKQNIKNAKDFESLIENGYVLDVRGQWIPLNEKVQKERSFIQHLEAGDVLVSGKWISISEAFKKPDYTVQNNDDQSLPTESSNDETQASSEANISEQEEDFPPETIMIAAEELQVNKSLKLESVQNVQQDKTADNQFSDTQKEDIVTQETIAMSLHVISEIAAHHQKPCRNDYDSTTCSVQQTEEKAGGNYRKILLLIAVLASIIGLAIYLVFRFFPGLLQ